MVNVHLFPENLSLLYVCVKSMGVYDSVQTMFDCDFHENVRLDRIVIHLSPPPPTTTVFIPCPQ